MLLWYYTIVISRKQVCIKLHNYRDVSIDELSLNIVWITCKDITLFIWFVYYRAPQSHPHNAQAYTGIELLSFVSWMRERSKIAISR